jgi:hypothetical protein
VCRSLESPCAAIAALESATLNVSKENGMATRFLSKALVTAALGIALSLLLAATTTASPASSNTPEALQLDLPAAPSHCHSRVYRGDPLEGDITVVSWRDNSTNEDGFILEIWRRESGTWVPAGSFSTTGTSMSFDFRLGPSWKFRVKAFNAAGDSDWSNWAH